MSDFQKLAVWQKAMVFVSAVYKLTATFPSEEKFGLTNQLRHAAVSIPSNIAEGAARATKKDFANFLVIARGSASEVETQILLAIQLNFLAAQTAQETIEQVVEIRKMLNGLIQHLTKK